MPAGLEGTAIGIGGKVRPCTRVVDQFWIRSAIDSHGSAPDRMSRAVPSLWAGARVEPNRANTTARCVERVLKRWREQRCGIGCRPGCRRRWRVSGTPGGERRQGHGHMHYERGPRGRRLEWRWLSRLEGRGL